MPKTRIWAALLLFATGAAGGWVVAEAANKPKGYLVAEITVTDPEAYKSYVPGAGKVVTAHGGRYLARGGRTEALEGPAPAARFVIVEFPSFEQARTFYRSAEYQQLAPIRQKASKSRFWLAEGLPQ